MQERFFAGSQYAEWFWEKPPSPEQEAFNKEYGPAIDKMRQLEWQLFYIWATDGALSIIRELRLLRAVRAAAEAKKLTLGGAVGDGTAAVVRDVLKGSKPLSALTAQQRVAAAAWYRGVAERVVGSRAADAARYNVARAEFLEGARAELSPSLPEFIANGFK